MVSQVQVVSTLFLKFNLVKLSRIRIFKDNKGHEKQNI